MSSQPSSERFCADAPEPARRGHSERRTLWVVVLTTCMMVAELVVGAMTRSLALTADGWHMATHAGALGLSALAYWFARTRAGKASLAFGTGKVLALAGYTNAILLLVVAVMMVLEATRRLVTPVQVHFQQALPIAVVGLLVNLVSAKLLAPPRVDDAEHGHSHAKDHNLHAAYLHVMADALTSVLAIVALIGVRYAGLTFLDPAMAIVGSIIIVRWGLGLCQTSARQLLDATASTQVADIIRQTIESMDARVVDLHLWELGPGRRGCIVSLLASTPRPVDEYRRAVLQAEPIEHLTIEVQHR